MFITFEGGEGAGKSTLAKSVVEHLAREKSVLFTREPGGTKLGESVRELLLHGEKVTPQTELFLFLAARIQHIEEVIKPALHQGKIVVCDRFSDSTIAYQGGGRKLGVASVAEMTRLAIHDFQPDLTFYIDIDPQVGLLRAKGRKAHDRIEKEAIDFHQRVRAAFLQLAKESPKRMIVLDGMKSKEELLREALDILKRNVA